MALVIDPHSDQGSSRDDPILFPDLDKHRIQDQEGEGTLEPSVGKRRNLGVQLGSEPLPKDLENELPHRTLSDLRNLPRGDTLEVHLHHGQNGGLRCSDNA